MHGAGTPAEVAFDVRNRTKNSWRTGIVRWVVPTRYEPAVSDSVWSKMLESDPVGATWGPGVRRAPQTTTWGWNLTAVAKTQTPTLMVAGAHDKQVQPACVKELLRRPRFPREGVRGPGLLVTQRDVGEKPYAPVSRVPRVADARHRERDQAGSVAAGIRGQRVIRSDARGRVSRAQRMTRPLPIFLIFVDRACCLAPRVSDQRTMWRPVGAGGGVDGPITLRTRPSE